MATSDQELLLSIFPNEVWTVIMGKVKTAKDYQNICGSSCYFESFLRPRCTQILFPEVAQFLVNQYLSTRYGVYTQAVRNCREVCRAWKAGMDHVLQNPVWYSKFPSGWTYVQEFEDKFDQEHLDKFENLMDFEKFQEHFEETHSQGQINPFVCRGVIFVVKDDQLLESYCLAWAELLEKYGHHIRYCAVHFSIFDMFEPDPEIQLKCYKKLAQMLELMSRLKSLEFFVGYSESAGKQLLKSWEKCNNAANQIRFPNLPNLHFLGLWGMPLAFVRNIVEMNTQVRIVDARHAKCNELKIYLEGLPALTQLAADLRNEDTLEIVRDASMKCKIDTLRVDTSWAGSWNAIFDVLETKFSDNLTELILTLPSLRRKITRAKGLTLPKLTVLDLKLRNPVPLDFLLELAPTLQKLYVKTDGFETSRDFQVVKDNEGVVKLFRFWKTPYKCNVWRLFPKLLLLKNRLWSVSYAATRADWEKYQSRRRE